MINEDRKAKRLPEKSIDMIILLTDGDPTSGESLTDNNDTTILYYTVLYYTILYCTLLYSTILLMYLKFSTFLMLNLHLYRRN